MYLLKEVTSDVRHQIVEAVNDQPKQYWIEGIFAQADKKNRNQRIYPLPVMKKGVDKYIAEAVTQKRGYGELGHPDAPGINMPLVSHLTQDLRFEGNDVYGKAKILNTPNGNIVKALIDEGAVFGVSTRALGSLHRDRDTFIVQEDFMLSAIDIVADPSAHDAFVTGLMESKQWIYENGIIREKDVEDLRKEVEKAPKQQVNEQLFLEIFHKYLDKLTTEPKKSK